MKRKYKKNVINLLDEIYSLLIHYNCHDEKILSQIDDLQNDIENYNETDKVEHCEDCGDDQNALVSCKNIKLCESCHAERLLML